MPVQLTLTPQSHVEAVANSTLNLTCQARGYPVPSITWYKDNTPLNEAVGIHTTMSGIVATSQLVFESTQLSDNGIYECQATNTLAAPTMQRSNISFHVLRELVYHTKVNIIVWWIFVSFQVVNISTYMHLWAGGSF